MQGTAAARPHTPGAPQTVLVIAAGPDGVPALTMPPGVHATDAADVSAGLAALDAAPFDCVLAQVAGPDAAVLEVAATLRDRCGTAALVVLVDSTRPIPAGLADLADHVVHPGADPDWPTLLRRRRTTVGTLSRLSGIVDSLVDAVFTTDLDGVITSWNAGAQELYGYPAVEAVGAEVAVLHPPASDEPRRIIAMVRAGESVRGLESVRRTRDGRMVEVAVDATPLRSEDGGLDGVVVVARDISARRELEAELVRATMHDALTGLPNRAYLAYRLSQALAASRAGNRPVAVLHVDLDQFRAVADVYGHVAGDEALVLVAERLRSVARPTDTVARVGDDEFVVVCPGLDVAAADRLADRVLDSVARPIAVRGHALRLGASVGIAVSPPLEDDAEMLLRHADAAMSEAKARGRARSQLFDPALTRRAGERRRLAADLRQAVAEGHLVVHYQPVVALASEAVVGLEALARWHHPTYGAVPPSTFVPLAESNGIAADLDRWILGRACHEAVAAMAAGAVPPTARVAVNLSARSLDHSGVVAMVEGVLRQSGLPATSLVLEITETALLESRDAARDSLDGLRGLGAGIALDDFGTGYSSLSFLREFPVTAVKIDQSFVRGALERAEDLAITEAIVRLAAGLGLDTIAEGVETTGQRDLLRRLGCATAQGHLWSGARPPHLLGLPTTGPVGPAPIAS
jgi:diguanylate cyclase (GGDEF)-like protein/PAS domain S-box-containing protein